MSDDEGIKQDAPDDIAADDASDDANPDDGMTVADALNLDEMAGELLDEGPQREYAMGEAMAGDVSAIYDIPVQISAVLGRSTMQVSQLLKLGRGAVVDLDRKVGEAIDIYVNNRLVARGEVVVVEDKLGITMTEIVKSER
jgi:flagellar motor switch protein FliN/FliY|tara:strand:- start:293514 stop:293936 length:423 start_codon:yes stop_codon:yes gene_type:complete